MILRNSIPFIKLNQADRMNLFYTETIHQSEAVSIFLLEGQEAHHAVQVLRLKAGDHLHATDGKGHIFHGVIKEVNKTSVRAAIEQQVAHPAPTPEICIAIGLIKKRERLEFAIEKAVELGVTRFVIFNADRSEKKGMRLERLKTAALGAMKQSLRCWLPVIEECPNLDTLLKNYEGIKTIVADEKEEPGSAGRRVWNRHQKLLFIVGPEGGFSDRERDVLDQTDAERFSLGRYRLRTETAVIALAGLFLE